MQKLKRTLAAVLALGALVGLLFAATPQVRADDQPMWCITYFYVEIVGPADPSMGGNQPLIASGDTPTPPSYNDVMGRYGDAVTGGGGYTVVEVTEDENGAIVDMQFHSAGDFP